MQWLTIGMAVLFALPALAQEEPPLETLKLGPGLAMLVGRGGNIGVVHGPDGVLLVDDQFAPSTPAIREAIARLGARPIRFVLNTHWHGDHTGGNENFATDGALIVAHSKVRERMSVDQWNPMRQQATPASPAAALPIVTFDDGIRFHLNGYDVEVLHVDPAHTDGDSIVVIEAANLMHLGDTYFNGLYPFIDAASGGSVDGVIDAVDRALSLSDEQTRIIPGHGPLSNRAELQAYRDMLKAVRDNVKKGVDAGRSADEVVASRPTKEFDEKWGGGFLSPEVFTRIVYAMLAETGAP